MCEDVAPDRLLRIGMGHSVAWVCHHLISHVDCDVELLGQLYQFA